MNLFLQVVISLLIAFLLLIIISIIDFNIFYKKQYEDMSIYGKEKRIYMIMEEILNKSGLFCGIRIRMKSRYDKSYGTPFCVNYLFPEKKDKMKSDHLSLLFGNKSKGVVHMTLDMKKEWEEKRLEEVNKFRKENNLPLLINI